MNNELLLEYRYIKIPRINTASCKSIMSCLLRTNFLVHKKFKEKNNYEKLRKSIIL